MTAKSLTRLIKAAKEFNIGHATLLGFLKEKKFDVKDFTVNSKLSVEMYAALEKEFREDKEVKERSEQIDIKPTELFKIIESNKHKETEEPAPQEKTADGNPKVEPNAELKVDNDDFIPTSIPETKPIKVFDNIDVEALAKKKPKDKKKEPASKTPKVTNKSDKAKDDIIFSGVVASQDKKVQEDKTQEVEVNRAPDIDYKPLNIINKIDIEEIKDKEQQVQDNRRRRIVPVKPYPKEDKQSSQSDNKEGFAKYSPAPDQQDAKDRQQAFQQRRMPNFGNFANAYRPKKRYKHKSKKNKTQVKKQDVVEHMDRKAQGSVLQLTEFISVADFASVMNISPTQVISKCMDIGAMVSINQRIDAEIIELVAEEFGFKVEFITEPSVVDDSVEEEEDPKDLKPRNPIVTIMGHVDHGKTSLLDFIRQANVIAGEAGGITQHIGAYGVTLKDGRNITFLDTPGHESFTAMRARGSKVTDIVVIMIAADDTVMPQTKEAINHAQAAGAPMIFAINKIDKPGAQPEKIKEQLSNMNILVEDWGGKFQCEHISAKTGEGVDKLLEKILLESELMELTANPNKLAKGTVLEASLEKGRGYVTNILVREGTLKVGDFVVAGTYFGRVKAMFNERNKKIEVAGPSTPATILGLSGGAQLGESFQVFESESKAKEIASYRGQVLREQTMKTKRHITLEEIGRRIDIGNFKELNLIIKGDFDGSVEALADSLQKLSNDEINVQVIHKGAGQVSESDVLLAAASNSIIIAFQVRPSSQASQLADKEQIDIKTYSIIYQAIDDVRAAIEGMMSPTIKEHIVGNLEIREIFKIEGQVIAGCFVVKGKVTKDALLKVIRDGVVIYAGPENHPATVESLYRFKNEVKEVTVGVECGLVIKNYQDIKVGDELEIYEVESVKKTL